MVKVASLNSGSNGNCYYIGSNEGAVLIDAGISAREMEKRMRKLGLPLDSLKAIFISHEHIDHVKGLDVMAQRYDLPVYASLPTIRNTHTLPPAHLLRPLRNLEPVAIAGMEVLAFPKWHDAVDPSSFIVSCNGIRIGIFTDIGAPCEQVRYHFSLCHAAFLEANYDDDMLNNGKYPYHLKKRISGDQGHLSNKQALDLFLSYRAPYMSHLWLAHLSRENNDPDVALATFRPHAQSVQVSVASRYNESEVFRITGSKEEPVPAKGVQMSLF